MNLEKNFILFTFFQLYRTHTLKILPPKITFARTKSEMLEYFKIVFVVVCQSRCMM